MIQLAELQKSFTKRKEAVRVDSFVDITVTLGSHSLNDFSTRLVV